MISIFLNFILLSLKLIIGEHKKSMYVYVGFYIKATYFRLERHNQQILSCAYSQN